MRAFKTGMLIASVFVVVGVVSFLPENKPATIAQINCAHNNEDHTLVSTQHKCLNIEQNKSWAAWLKGESRSAQFHYLDLLELLSTPFM
ncbi:hypothetical protein J8L70_05215 [Pseudoalteromonas sp. MMG010]|uniref:hypothetical protein n=1 Tax=Pseudoalteromonas sp. MMG010 TaxID=2822685 RepID=UPI001B39DF87|nr:hypothetical protein [Pseudoalteromonas sp. MMG010]MBQ4832634.1 hypothetical protein [Pseudoalteromonas sp. MMG010]